MEEAEETYVPRTVSEGCREHLVDRSKGRIDADGMLQVRCQRCWQGLLLEPGQAYTPVTEH